MRNTKYKSGFTIVELLIALVITAIVLTAVAVAFNASVINYRENENIFNTINNPRQALIQMTTQLRNAYAVDHTAPANECSFIKVFGGDSFTFRYVSSDQKIYLVDSTGSHTLCDNVTAATFTKTCTTEDSVTYVKSVQISITVEINGSARTVSAATAIRKNLN